MIKIYLLFFFSIFCNLCLGEDTFSHAELQINNGEYLKLGKEIRDWLEDESEESKKLTKYVRINEE